MQLLYLTFSDICRKNKRIYDLTNMLQDKLNVGWPAGMWHILNINFCHTVHLPAALLSTHTHTYARTHARAHAYVCVCVYVYIYIYIYIYIYVALWLRHCATSRTLPGSIPGSVTGDFFRGTPDRTMCPDVDSASESEYQGFLLG